MPRTANAASCRASASWLLAPPQTTRQRKQGMVASFSTAPIAAGANTSTCWAWISSGGEKLAALAWNRDPREIKTDRPAGSAGAQSAIGRKPAEERVFRPTLLHLADRICTRLRAKSKPGRTVTVRVRFADLNSATRSVTLDAPI